MDTNTIASIFSLVCGLTSIVGLFMMFRDMGRSGWLSLIPLYNTYVMFDEVYGNGWRFLFLLIPFFNIYVIIKLLIDWVRNYGLTVGFLLYLIPPFLSVLFAR